MLAKSLKREQQTSGRQGKRQKDAEDLMDVEGTVTVIEAASPSTADSSQTVPITMLSDYTIPNIESPPFPATPNGGNCINVLLENTLSLISLQWKPKQLIRLHAKITESSKEAWVLMCDGQNHPLQFSYTFRQLLGDRRVQKWKPVMVQTKSCWPKHSLHRYGD